MDQSQKRKKIFFDFLPFLYFARAFFKMDDRFERGGVERDFYLSERSRQQDSSQLTVIPVQNRQ